MADTPTDPRHRGFAAAVRPPAPESTQPRRGIAGPPPSTPVITNIPPLDDEPTPASPTRTEPASARPGRLADTLGSQHLLSVRTHPEHDRGRGGLGVQRHNMRYVQFQVTPAISDLLTDRAETEDVVLGEVVMDALRAFDTKPTTATTFRRRRRGKTTVRRSILVRPEEADQIKTMADKHALTPSGLIRRSLEQYLA
jgi:hypothetical protein